MISLMSPAGRISKMLPYLSEAIQEATGAPVKERLRSLNKQDLAAEAEHSVTGTRWLPELLRK